jgi:hypothetical protein
VWCRAELEVAVRLSGVGNGEIESEGVTCADDRRKEGVRVEGGGGFLRIRGDGITVAKSYDGVEIIVACGTESVVG